MPAFATLNARLTDEIRAESIRAWRLTQAAARVLGITQLPLEAQGRDEKP